MKRIPIIGLLAACAACGPGSGESQIMNPDEFAPIYATVLIQAAVTDTGKVAHTTARERQDSILTESGITREQFFATLEWHNKDPRRWASLLENVVRHLEEKTEPSGP